MPGGELYTRYGKGVYIFSAYSLVPRIAGRRAGRVSAVRQHAERRRKRVTVSPQDPEDRDRFRTNRRPFSAPGRASTVRSVYLAAVIFAFYLFTVHFAPMTSRSTGSSCSAGWSFLVSYGLWRGRGSNTVNQFLLAGKTMPWYAMGLSIMATQASAITFISTTGQAYVDGMRFVQFYFGLPIAMVILSATAVPIFHRAKVYTAYEYLEQRFDAKTRALVTAIFLIERGLQRRRRAGRARRSCCRVMLGWPFHWTTHHHGRPGDSVTPPSAASKPSPGPTCSR